MSYGIQPVKLALTAYLAIEGFFTPIRKKYLNLGRLMMVLRFQDHEIMPNVRTRFKSSMAPEFRAARATLIAAHCTQANTNQVGAISAEQT